MSKVSRIHILSPELANQIAAGEVVERPASVVKELVENSLDAGASSVEVEVQGGGLELLRVTDNGTGMTQEEALLSLKRHATSKIRTSEDLFCIQTLGFRGEALPSIAAVSRLTLITRTSDAVGGFLFTSEGGRMQGPGREIGASVGTQIEVRDLFFNVPARLKFMKSEATEFGHIQETLLRLALAFPQTHFKLKRSGNLVLDFPPHLSVWERAQAVLQKRGNSEENTTLYRALSRENGVEIEAFLSSPEESVSSARNVYLFVNQRFIRDRSLLHAITSAYGDTIGTGRFPIAVLHLRVPEAEVDINVHPQKLEARFLNARILYASVHEMVQRLVFQSPWLLSENLSSLSPDLRIPQTSWMSAAEDRPTYGTSPTLAPEQSWSNRKPTHSIERVGSQNLSIAWPEDNPAPLKPVQVTNEIGTRILFAQLRYLGQLLKTYLLCEGQDQLLLIDQHAAHERLAFERLRVAYQSHTIKAQRLLFPMNLQFEPTRAALLEEHLSLLGELGFELRPFGASSFALLSMPDMAEFGRGAKTYQDPKKGLETVLDELEQHGKANAPHTNLEHILATLACHSVVRAGDVLDAIQAKALLTAMDEIEFIPYCPHGRPVLVRIGRHELEKRFGRTT